MREIKFRAWDGSNMINVGSLTFLESEEIIVNDELVNIKIMSYVGLKDKNGKEIYEGDIVKGYGGAGGYTQDVIGVVKYGGLSFAYVGKRKDDEDWFDTITNPLITKDNYIEVIGNINETPSLLPKERKTV